MHTAMRSLIVLALTLTTGLAAGGEHFRKVSNRGWLLPDTASLGNGRDDWACTLDVDTGLTWEVKPENGPRSATYKYTWRRGSLGIVGNMSSCGNSLDGAACNTQNYVDAVNDAVLCGAADWRVSGGSYSSGYVSNNPHGELAVLYQRLFAASGIDPADWMPNLQPFWYWTDVTYPVQVSSSWAVNFGTAKAFYNYWDSPYHVVLVSDTAGDTFFADGFDEAADFVEGFDSLDEVNAHGWLVGNMSEPEGEFGWFYGGDNVFPAQAGASTSQVPANYAATVDAGGTISAWLLTPLLEFRAGSTLSFWTRTVTGASRADRLQVLVCQGTPCDYVGPGALGYSDFGTLLLDINPSQLTGDDETGVFGYPDHWTRFTLDATQGIPTGGYGRIAFRYFVEDGGLNGASSNYIGLDSVRVEAILAE